MSPDPTIMHLSHTMTHYKKRQRDPLIIMALTTATRLQPQFVVKDLNDDAFSSCSFLSV
jgi:hypothetical protein